MSLMLRVLSGARAGHEQVLEKSIVVAGRHPMCDLRFDAELDRDVSTRHAEIRALEDAWVLRDLGSTNGTYVNGERLAAERVLSVRDTVSFGEFGPRIEVVALSPYFVGGEATVRSPGPQQVAAQASLAAAAAAAAAAPNAPGHPPVRKTVVSGERAAQRGPRVAPLPPPPPSRPLRPRPNTGERVAQAVRESTRGLRWLVGATLALLIVAVATAYYLNRRGDVRRSAQIEALLTRNDSLAAAFEREMARVSGTLTGLDSALALARVEGDTLRARLARARSPEEIAVATAQLERVQVQRARLVSVGQLDNAAIAERNGPAVAFLAVRMPDGTMFTGTAFSVTRDGLLVTNRHLVRDPASGTVAQELLVKFNGARQWIPTKVLRIIEGDDLALLQADARGPFPTVAGVATAGAGVGAPTLLLGFPLGMDTPMEGRDLQEFTARATLGTATVSKVLPDVLQLDAYAGEGSSGSPVFDRAGRVTGVVYGGARASGGRIVYAVPAARLLAALPAGVGR